jgi:hypothetical protein
VILKTDHKAVLANTSLAHRRAVDEVVGLAKRNAPVGVSRGLKLNAGSVQGGLRGSITADHFGPLSSRVGSPMRYAMMREYGGVILPVRRKLLSWIDPTTGRRIFAKRVVQRPGGPRQGYKPWLRPAGDRYPEFMDDHLKALG